MTVLGREDLKALVSQHAAWLYALAFRITQSIPLAQQATAHAFRNAMNASVTQEKFRQEAVRHLLQYLKQTSPKESSSEELSLDEELNLEGSIARERRAALVILIACLKRLSFEERALLLMRDQAHLSCEAIGEILNQPRRDIRKRLIAIRLKVRDLIGGISEIKNDASMR